MFGSCRSSANGELRGGAIVMQCGDQIGSEGQVRPGEFLRDVLESLTAIHLAGYFHTDLRLPNILKFTSGYQIIDFDLAVRIRDPPHKTFVNLQGRGGQYESLGWRFRNAEGWVTVIGEIDEVITVAWTAADDLDMLYRTIHLSSIGLP